MFRLLLLFPLLVASLPAQDEAGSGDSRAGSAADQRDNEAATSGEETARPTGLYGAEQENHFLTQLVPGDHGDPVSADEEADGNGDEPGIDEEGEFTGTDGGEAVELGLTERWPDVEDTVTLSDGSEIPYRARHAAIELLAQDGETARGLIHFTEYRRLGSVGGEPLPDAERPLLFCFNGGPGSASVWLHLGAWGPRIIELDAEGLEVPRPPVRLMENPDCLLDVADLVFVDPIGTGFSRPEGETEGQEFWNLEADLDSCAEFIVRYLSNQRRWDSPTWIAGESYGGMRVAGLAPRLQQQGVPLRGVAIVSGVLDFATLRDQLVSVASFLPTYATTAAYHLDRLRRSTDEADVRLGRELEARLGTGEQADGEFSIEHLRSVHDNAVTALGGGLAPWLYPGHQTEAEVSGFVDLLAQLTGLDPGLIKDCELLPSPSVFRDQLLSGLTLGRFDARAFGPDDHPLVDYARSDPSLDMIFAAFANAANAYLRQDLGVEEPLDYSVLADLDWSWARYQNGYASLTEELDQALAADPHLELFVAMGFYDLATPPEAIRHSLHQLDHGAGRWSEHWYEGGHMMYLKASERRALSEDLRAWMTD